MSDIRKEFEAIEASSDLRRDDDEGDYLNPCVQSAWEGYQKGRAIALRTPSAARVVQEGWEPPAEGYSYDWPNSQAAVPAEQGGETVAVPVDAIPRDFPGDDAIARSKRILELVDTYHDSPDRMNRNALRGALMDEFTELLATPVPHSREAAEQGDE